jgi:hypothetical protein
MQGEVPIIHIQKEQVRSGEVMTNMEDEERRKPSMPDGELEEKLEGLVKQAEHDFKKKYGDKITRIGFGRVSDCELCDGTEIYLEKGYRTKIEGSAHKGKAQWDEMKDCKRLSFSDVNVRVNRGEIVIFDQGGYEPCPDWMRVYSPNLEYQFTIRQNDSLRGGDTFYSPYHGRDFKVYEGMQD